MIDAVRQDSRYIGGAAPAAGRPTGCWCARIARHAALVTIQDFLAVATMRAQPDQTPSEPRQRSGAHTAAPDQLCHLRPHHERLIQRGRVRYRCRPIPGDRAASHRSSVYVAESRVLIALEPWLRRQREAGPSWPIANPHRV